MGIFRVSVLAAILLAPLALLETSRAERKTEPVAAAVLVVKAGQIAQDVSKLRGLKLKKPIVRGVMSKEEIRARIIEILDREYTPEELDSESLGLKRLGLIPEKTDFVKMMLDMLQDQIAGFYDQHEKKLYIAGWAQSGGDMLMAHEIDHALQDQHFDLDAFMSANRKNGDSVAARQALVEGDGMALMLEYKMAQAKQAPPWGNPMIMAMLRKGMVQGAANMASVPLALREGLMFPYIAGVEFVAHFRKHKSWKTIDAMYRKPPLSTEQILHPEKYESYEMPIEIAAKQPSGLAGYSEKVSNVMGEKGVELFLRTHGVRDDRAVTAAAGWGGDRFAVYARHGHKGSALAGTVGVWFTTWDEALDANEFFDALEHALPKLSKDKGSARGSVLRFKSARGQIVAERRGAEVLLLLGVSSGASDAIRVDVWKTWKRPTRPNAAP
jgi:hypothetical protein